MKKRKKNSDSKIILLVIALIVLLLIIIFTMIKNRQEEKAEKESSVNVIITAEELENRAEQAELEKIKSMNERTRIEYYVSKYVQLIEKEEYDKAYDLLNNAYKKNYFKTQKDFKEYCQKTFSNMLNVDFINFERNGEIYVIWVTITDAINGTKGEGLEMNFVVKENDFNDYELSFSVV